jgi:hypothetical protein
MSRILENRKRIATPLRIGVFLIMIGLVTGCSGLRTYPNTMKKNLFVDLKTDHGVRVRLDVYKVDSKCEANYEGTVSLDKGRTAVGIPTDSRVFLEFDFARHSFWKGKSQMGHGTLIRFRPGKVYRAEVVYEDDMYGVEVIEAGSPNTKGKEVAHMELSDCKPGNE